MKKLLPLLFLLCPLVAQADVTVYGLCEYKGAGVSLAPGDYTASDLAKVGIPEDRIESIDVPRGYVVTVHEHDKFQGRYGTLRRSDSCLKNDRFSGIISSLSIRQTFGSSTSATSLPANTDSAPTNKVTLYSDCDFKGAAASLDVGDYNLNQLRLLGIENNTLSSVKVPAGYSITLYENDFLRGRAGELQRDDSCLVNDEFNDMVSSVSIRSTGALTKKPAPIKVAKQAPITLFTGCNYANSAIELQVGEYNNAALNKLGFKNNSISAIKVSDGYEVELFENDFFRGRSGTLRQDDPCLIDDRFNDTITSIIVKKNPRVAQASTKQTAEPVVTVYAYCNYKGGSATLPAGRFNQSALLKQLIKNNAISSIKVAEGYQATLYDSGNFSGTSVKTVGNDECLDDNNLNRKVSSIVIEPLVAKTSTTLRELNGGQNAVKTNFDAVNEALACVKQYADRSICDSHRWKDMAERCGVDKHELLKDGYLRGHVDAGNCRPEYWDELSRRTANPRLR